MTKPILLAAALAASLALTACDVSSSKFDYAAADDTAKTEFLQAKSLDFVRTEAISGFNMLGGNPMAQTFGPKLPKTEITRFRADLRSRTIHLTIVVGGLHIDQSFGNIASTFGSGSSSAGVSAAKQRQEKQQTACAEYARSVFAEHDLRLTIRTSNGTRTLPGQISLNHSTCRRQLQS